MKAFLLAAGKGTRISKSIQNIPKCTLDVGGKPLIRRTVEMLIANNVEVTVIVGYKQDHVRKVLMDMPVNIVYNPFFDITNSIGSLWMARDYFGEEDTIIANADVFWSQEILDRVLASDKDNIMLADYNRVDDGDYFFYVQDGLIKKYGKELEREERNCEYVGIAQIKKEFVDTFVKRLDKLVGGQQHGIWWENVLYSFIGEKDINVLDISGTFWSEIDFIEDYHRIIEYVEKNQDK
ncbi:MAG: phosphocholine cytidylyltransferase family protein [Lachnospiraceae bacterium]|nr:phosphocholine cytidylyltransferase family protein [Lachnospiraceae bacterium]